MLEEIWDFPMTLLAWIVFHLVVLTNGNIRWINTVAIWLELSEETVKELLDK